MVHVVLDFLFLYAIQSKWTKHPPRLRNYRRETMTRPTSVVTTAATGADLQRHDLSARSNIPDMNVMSLGHNNCELAISTKRRGFSRAAQRNDQLYRSRLHLPYANCAVCAGCQQACATAAQLGGVHTITMPCTLWPSSTNCQGC